MDWWNLMKQSVTVGVQLLWGGHYGCNNGRYGCTIVMSYIEINKAVSQWLLTFNLCVSVTWPLTCAFHIPCTHTPEITDMHRGMCDDIVGTLGCVFIDNETHESGVTKCTTGEAWSEFSWHHSSVFHCQWTHNQVFLLLSHMLIQNAKSIFIYVMKYVSGFIWKLGINFAVCIKWIDEIWWNNRLLLVPNCYEVVAMVAIMVAMVAPLWCHTLR